MLVRIKIAAVERGNPLAEFFMRQQLPEFAAMYAALRAHEQQNRTFTLQLACRSDGSEGTFRDAEQLRTAAQRVIIRRHAQRVGAFAVGLHARHPHHALRGACRCRAGLAQGADINGGNWRLLRPRQLRDPAIRNTVSAINHIVIQRLAPERRNVFPDDFMVMGHLENTPVRAFVNQGVAVFQTLHVADVRAVETVRIGRLRQVRLIRRVAPLDIKGNRVNLEDPRMIAPGVFHAVRRRRVRCAISGPAAVIENQDIARSR